MKIGGSDSFFDQVGLDVIEAPNRPKQYLLRQDPFVFLTWFDSPIGIELLDIRKVLLMNLRKSPELLALLDSFEPPTLGQWVFACDTDGFCNLTFGIQLDRNSLTRQVALDALNYLRGHEELAREILYEIAQDPSRYPGCLKATGVSVPSKTTAIEDADLGDDYWASRMDHAYELLDNNRNDEARDTFRALAKEGLVRAKVALLHEFRDDYTDEEALASAEDALSQALGRDQASELTLKCSLIPSILMSLVTSAQAKFKLQEDLDDMDPLMDRVREAGRFFEDSAQSLLKDWEDERTLDLAVRFADLRQAFFSNWDLNAMPMSHAGIVMESLHYIATKSSETNVREWALGQISQMVESWQDRIPATVLLWPAAIELLPIYKP